MRKTVLFVCMMISSVCYAAPFKVALLDCKDETGLKPDAVLGGEIAAGAVAQKGIYSFSKQLLKGDAFVLIDRRDFITEMEKLAVKDKEVNGKTAATPPFLNAVPGLGTGKEVNGKTATPSFLHAAQVLGADAVLRSSLLGFSTGKRKVDQGGYKTELSTLSIRVVLEALDAVDGTVIGMAEGVAESQFRQTQNVQTSLSENDVLQLLDQAFEKAVPDLAKALETRKAKQAGRKVLKLSIASTADPAMVEIDGVLVGTTPLKNHEIYEGDHVIT
ncbi:MAG: hypothetical protein PHR77_11160, partial [Kiritimatiellae bacterium]|nr:hypothetical protein [Kiritimatiellia bacterium]